VTLDAAALDPAARWDSFMHVMPLGKVQQAKRELLRPADLEELAAVNLRFPERQAAANSGPSTPCRTGKNPQCQVERDAETAQEAGS
jgi:hypothetical protein